MWVGGLEVGTPGLAHALPLEPQPSPLNRFEHTLDSQLELVKMDELLENALQFHIKEFS